MAAQFACPLHPTFYKSKRHPVDALLTGRSFSKNTGPPTQRCLRPLLTHCCFARGFVFGVEDPGLFGGSGFSADG